MVDPKQLEKYEVLPGNTDGEIDNAAVLSGQEKHFAPSHGTKHLRGIVYRGPYENPTDGVCVAVRRHANALAGTGVPLFLKSSSYSVQCETGTQVLSRYCELDEEVLAELGTLTACEMQECVLSIQHIYPTLRGIDAVLRPRTMASIDPNGLRRVAASTIILGAWERDRVGEETAGLLNMAGGIWVPCQSNKKALQDSGVIRPIDVIPHPHYDDDPILSVKRSSLQARPFRFLHVGKWEPRKDQHTMIGGFLKWFSPRENVDLVIKTRPYGQWKAYPETSSKSIEKWLSDPDVQAQGWTAEAVNEHIKIISARLARSDPQGGVSMVSLYGMCDAYVSSGHGEGFDLPAYDAKLSGMPMVFCPHTGPEDFSTEGDVEIHTEPAPCDPYYGWEPECCWQGYDSQDIGSAMRVAYTKRDLPRAPLDRSGFTMAAVGQAMKASCQRLISSLGGNPGELWSEL